MLYRQEIDGLRTLAVLPVVFFHAGFYGFSGGYVGVDIFFVISGYLITSIILEEKKNGNFSIINFYERRARRILPALLFLLVITTITAYLVMPPNLLKSYSQSMISVASFLSNVYFYLTSGYFSLASDEKPLLHTWSLAVEEQYYLIFPVIITAFWSLGRRWLLCGILVLSAASLFYAQYLSSILAVNANFYLIFSRAWEIFFGSMLAFTSLTAFYVKPIQREVLSIFGLVLIAYSVVAFDGQTPFPSVYTLIPVLGTCIILYFANATTYVGALLANRAAVSIGLISYSLYLWHQPIFAFMRMKTVGEPSHAEFTGAIVIAFLLASLSVKYIEKPFRGKSKYTRSQIFKYSAASLITIFTIGAAGHLYQGFEKRFEDSIYNNSMVSSPKSYCHTTGYDYTSPKDACRYFGDNVTWAAFGDSHVVEPAFALARKIEDQGQGLIHLSFKGCPPALLFEVKKPGCSRWINDSLEYLEKNESISRILLGFRHSYYLFGTQLDVYPRIPNRSFSELLTSTSLQKASGDIRETYWQSYREIIIRLLAANKTVFVLYPIPELPMDIHKAVRSFSVLGSGTVLNLNDTTEIEYYRKRNKFIINKLDTLEYGRKLYAIRPVEIICGEKYCPAVSNDAALYYDDNHLSLAGASLIAKSIKIRPDVSTRNDSHFDDSVNRSE